jgi:hypothetical protein
VLIIFITSLSVPVMMFKVFSSFNRCAIAAVQTNPRAMDYVFVYIL